MVQEFFFLKTAFWVNAIMADLTVVLTLLRRNCYVWFWGDRKLYTALWPGKGLLASLTRDLERFLCSRSTPSAGKKELRETSDYFYALISCYAPLRPVVHLVAGILRTREDEVGGGWATERTLVFLSYYSLMEGYCLFSSNLFPVVCIICNIVSVLVGTFFYPPIVPFIAMYYQR